MKFLFSILASTALGQDAVPSLPPGFSSPAQSPTTPPTLPPTVTRENRCQKNSGRFNFYQALGPSSGKMCPQYECESCCNDEKASTFVHDFMNSEGKITKHFIYNFSGCSGQTKNTDGQGHMSAKCQDYLNTNFCMSKCSPNTYLYRTGPAGKNKQDMRVCDYYCKSFYEACKDEHVCYNEDGLWDYIRDAATGKLDSTKEYDVFNCKGSYECKKISDTRIAQNKAKENVGAVLQGKKDEYCKTHNDQADFCNESKWEDTKPEELFCSRFTYGLYQYTQSGTANQPGIPCLDPNNEQTVINQVKAIEAGANAKEDKVKFETSPVCSTGLSAGAIAGIVIGSLVGVGLIAGLVWYFACRGGDESDDYAQGKQADTEAGSHQMSQKEPSRDAPSIVRSDYDPSASTKE